MFGKVLGNIDTYMTTEEDNLKNKINSFINYLNVERGYSPRTVDEYRLDLESSLGPFLGKLGVLNVKHVTKDGVQRYLDYLAKERGNCAATRARKLASAKAYFNYLVETGVLKENPALSIRSPKIENKQPDYLTDLEINRLLDAVKHRAKPEILQRDLAMIIILLHTGLRVSELTGLKLVDIDLGTKQLKILRKGRKEQYVPLNSEAVRVLGKYLSQREQQCQTDRCFVDLKGNSLSRVSIYNIVRRYFNLAGINKDKKGPHVLRHTFCTRLHRKGVDPFIIKELAGHKNLSTTMRYVSIEDKQQAHAVEKLVGLL